MKASSLSSLCHLPGRLCSTTLVLCLTVLLVPCAAESQTTTCIPRSVGIPPNFRAPNWWDAATPEYARYGTRLDDPRWLAAVSHSDGSTNSGHVDFRAVRRSDSLFLSWIVKVDPLINPDPNGNQDADILWFGIAQQGAKKPVIFRFSPSTVMTGNADNALGYSVKAWTADPVTFGGNDYLNLTTLVFASGSATPPPVWITKPTRLWVASGAGESWAFQTVIPTAGTSPNLTDGLNIGTDFKMWYQLTVRLTNDVSIPPAVYAWPRDPALPKISSVDGVGGPWVTAWWNFTLATAPAPGTCIGDLTIASNDDIGTTNTDPSKIEYTLPTKPLTTLPTGTAFDDIVPRNTFFLRPTNNTTGTIPNGDVTARFWVANWGSQPDWEEISDAAVNLWKEVPPPPTSTPPQPSNDLPVGLAPDAKRITLEWKMTVCQWFNFLPSATYSDADLNAWLSMNGAAGLCDLTKRYAAKTHQCVLAQFETPQGKPPRTFLRRSYWNNLDTKVKASRFVRDAAISVQGLHRSEGTDPKTLYLYVQTFNMPKRVGLSARRRDTPRLVHVYSDSLDRRPDPVFDDLRTSTLSHTYWVHVYRETADSVPRTDPKRPVLRAQTSFGYRVEHDGEIAGWKHSLTGNAHLERLAPNFYRLTVPNDSFESVTTAIEALEPRPTSVRLHAGISFPTGNFKNAYDRGFGATFDLERRLNNRISLVALFGYHRFDSTAATVSGPTPHLELYHVAGSLAMTAMSSGWVSVIVDAGGGMYWFKPGTSKTGAHAGVSLEYLPSLSLAVGLSARMHNVFTGGSNTRFAAVQAGGRVLF